jgi:5-methylcytosine-specific restriction enzyme subunit McrC
MTVERLNQALETEVLRATTHRGQKVLQARSYVGLMRFGRQTVQVLPKIDTGDGDRATAEHSAVRNLIHMLAQVGNFPIREHDVAPLLRHNRDWFEILTRLFATHLMEQWQRGPHSNYQSVDRDQPALKGKWRIADQLRRPGRDHVFAVTYDEFTADNGLNRVFRYVTERLWHQTRDGANRRLLGELRQWLDGVTLLPVMAAADAPPELISRLNRRFEPLLNLARLFLGAQTPQLDAGRDDTFAFVFDMNQLFEAFLVHTIRRQREQILPPALQTCSLHPQARRYARYLARTAGGRQLFRLRPDLAFHDAQAQPPFPLLLDAKYKRLKADDARLGVSQGDFYQMLAYAHRYHSPRVLLLYPQVNGPLRRHFQVLGTEDTVIAAATVNLHVDLCSAGGRQALVQELRDIFHGLWAADLGARQTLKQLDTSPVSTEAHHEPTP